MEIQSSEPIPIDPLGGHKLGSCYLISPVEKYQALDFRLLMKVINDPNVPTSHVERWVSLGRWFLDPPVEAGDIGTTNWPFGS